MYLMIMVFIAAAGEVSAPEAIESFDSLRSCHVSLLAIDELPTYNLLLGETTGYLAQGEVGGQVVQMFCVKNSISI